MNYGKDNRRVCTIYQLFKMTLPYNHFVTFCYGHSDHFPLEDLTTAMTCSFVWGNMS